MNKNNSNRILQAKYYFVQSILYLKNHQQSNSLKFDIFRSNEGEYCVFVFRYACMLLHPSDPRFDYDVFEVVEREEECYSLVAGTATLKRHLLERIWILSRNKIRHKTRTFSDLVNRKGKLMNKGNRSNHDLGL